MFLYYGHVNQEWSQVLDGNIDDGGVKATEEMESLQVYLDQHEGIKGIILVNLIPGVSISAIYRHRICCSVESVSACETTKTYTLYI